MTRLLLPLLLATAHAATVDATLLPLHPNDSTRLAMDPFGNVVSATANSPCQIPLATCAPLTISKTDPTGKLIFQRSLGQPGQRMQVTHVAIDRSGNLWVAVSTPEPGIPTFRPITDLIPSYSQPYTFLWQFTPDGSRILFASYLASGLMTQLKTDQNGDILALMDPQVVGTSPLGPSPSPFLTKFSPASSRLVYFVTLPEDMVLSSPDFSLGPDGTVCLGLVQKNANPAKQFVFEISSDGLRRQNQPIDLHPYAQAWRVAPLPGGGWWVAGHIDGPWLSPTPYAFQREPTAQAYQRWEDQQGVTPVGAIRSTKVFDLLVDPTHRDRIFAVGSSGLLRSPDNGWTWQQLSDAAAFRLRPTQMAAGAGRLWMLTTLNDLQLQFSDDLGESWQSAPLPPRVTLPAMAAHRTEPNTLFLAGRSVLWITRDAGQSWAAMGFDSFVDTVVTSPMDPATIVAVGDLYGSPGRNVSVSRNNGERFSAPVTLDSRAEAFQFDPLDPETIFYLAGPRLFRTNLKNLEHSTLIESPEDISAFDFHPSQAGTIFAAGPSGRLIRFSDYGASWRYESKDPSPAPPVQLVVGEGGVVHLALQSAGTDVFVAQVSRDGQPSYVSYLGGVNEERLANFQVTPSGLLLVAGQTESPDFPTTGPRLSGQTTPLNAASAQNSIFVTAFQPNGAIASSTILGGSRLDELLFTTPHPDGAFNLLGTTTSPDFPGINSAAPVEAARYFVAKLQP